MSMKIGSLHFDAEISNGEELKDNLEELTDNFTELEEATKDITGISDDLQTDFEFLSGETDILNENVKDLTDNVGELGDEMDGVDGFSGESGGEGGFSLLELFGGAKLLGSGKSILGGLSLGGLLTGGAAVGGSILGVSGLLEVLDRLEAFQTLDSILPQEIMDGFVMGTTPFAPLIGSAQLLRGIIKGDLQGGIQNAKRTFNKYKNAWMRLPENIKSSWNRLKTFIVDKPRNWARNVASDFYNGLKNYFKSRVQKVSDWIIKDPLGWGKDVASDFIEGIRNKLDGISIDVSEIFELPDWAKGNLIGEKSTQSTNTNTRKLSNSTTNNNVNQEVNIDITIEDTDNMNRRQIVNDVMDELERKYNFVGSGRNV